MIVDIGLVNVATALGVDVEPLDLPRDLFDNEVETTSEKELDRRAGPTMTRSGQIVTD